MCVWGSGSEVPGYDVVVTHPMDLGTVSQRLEAGAYASVGDVQTDVGLVWSNCQAFNLEGSPLFETSRDLGSRFDKGLAKLRRDCERKLVTQARKKNKKASKSADKKGGKRSETVGDGCSDAAEAEEEDAAAEAVDSGALEAAVLLGAQALVDRIAALPEAAAFTEPVDPR